MPTYQKVYLNYKKRVDELLYKSIEQKKPETLYKPLKYLLGGGGKRIRPMMVIFCCEAAGGKFKDALNASAAMELLHNFTLVHDDIMDNADTRRGKQTIHKKWNENVAILAGDYLIGLAYSYLVKTKSKNLDEILKIFSEGIIEVCEGQSYDKEFEERKKVSINEYMLMIGKKTAKMLETSAAIGALIGNADSSMFANLKSYALNTGLAFQIQDDLLDISADEQDFGKKIGGDLVEGKKTFLLLKAVDIIKDKKDKENILGIIENNGLENNQSKIEKIKNIYVKYGVIDSAKREIENYTALADKSLDNLKNTSSKNKLKWFSGMLMGRTF